MSDDHPLTHMRPSEHSLSNPHVPGSVEWKAWEKVDMMRYRDPVSRTVAAMTANRRLEALKRSLDTPQERAAREVDALIVEAGCEPVRDPWSAQFVAAMTAMHCGMWCPYGMAYDWDDDD